MPRETFDLDVAERRDDERKKNLEGYYFIDAVLSLTGCTYEHEAWDKIRQWKRVHDGAIEVSAAMAWYGKHPEYKIWKRRDATGQVCHLCGRIYRGQEAYKYFYNNDVTKACKQCIKELKPEYGRSIKTWDRRKRRASEQKRQKLKAAAKREAMVRAYTAELRDQGLPIAYPAGGVGGRGSDSSGGGDADRGSVAADRGGKDLPGGIELHDER